MVSYDVAQAIQYHVKLWIESLLGEYWYMYDVKINIEIPEVYCCSYFKIQTRGFYSLKMCQKCLDCKKCRLGSDCSLKQSS